jgi:hypothetical protein
MTVKTTLLTEKTIDGTTVEEHLNKAPADLAREIRASLSEGALRAAGRAALRMDDKALALKLFVDGCWMDDASRVASQLKRADEAKAYAEKAKMPRVALLEAAGYFNHVAKLAKR